MRASASNTLAPIAAEKFPLLRVRRWRLAAGIFLVLITAALCLLASTALQGPALLPFAGAVALATLLGVGPSTAAVVLSGVLYDVLFVPPLFRFSLNSQALVAVGCLVVVALITRAADRAIVRAGRDQKLRLLFRTLIGSEQVANAVQRSVQMLGRIDGHSNQELFGWALAPDDPSLPVKVTLYTGGRPQAEALAVHYRPDVGSHCFYFDLERLPFHADELEVDVRYADGSLVSNTPCMVQRPQPGTPRRNQTVLFLHISKTAGTAFREAMEENYRLSEIGYIYPDPPGMLCKDLNLLPLEQRRGLRLIAGHFQYGVHSFFPQESAYVTIVREPVSRVISEHRYLLEKRHENALAIPPAQSLIEMLENHSSVNIDNLMVRCFSGVNETDFPPGTISRDVFELALDHLRHGFSYIGHQGKLAEAYAALQHRFGWKPRPTFERINQTRFGSAADYEPARQTIEQFNRWDLLLYQEVLRLFP